MAKPRPIEFCVIQLSPEDSESVAGCLAGRLAAATKCWLCEEHGELRYDMYGTQVGYYCEEHWKMIAKEIVEREDAHQRLAEVQNQLETVKGAVEKGLAALLGLRTPLEKKPDLPDGWEIISPVRRFPKAGEFYWSDLVSDICRSVDDCDDFKYWIIRNKKYQPATVKEPTQP